jgi:tetratricopeptide (TPR) repeat protein
MIAVIALCGGGCGENAARINEKALQAFMAADQEEAVRLFKRALALDPDNPVSHYYLGWIYKMQGKTDEGIAEFKKTIAIYPEHRSAYNHLGDLYLAKGMLDEAIEAFQKGTAFSLDTVAAHYKLGVAYQQKGAPAEAADAFFEAGLFAITGNDKERALHAYGKLKEMGNQQLADELKEVLSPWFDPANEVSTQHQEPPL